VDQCPLFCSIDGCTSCEGPECAPDACTQAAMDQGYLGCEYWAVDLDNATEVVGGQVPDPTNPCVLYPGTKLVSGLPVCYSAGALAGTCDPPNATCPAGYACMVPSEGACAADGDHAPFAIVVSNPEGVPVAVTVTIFGGQSSSVVVAPGEIRALFPAQLGFVDVGLEGSAQQPNAYKITSSAPIVAYQFNPLDNVDVFSNDASLLIPRAGFGKRYLAISLPTLTRRGSGPGRDSYNGYTAIVAWKDDTQIRVTPTSNTVAGSDGTLALTAGVPHVFTLRAHDVLNLEAVEGPDPFSADGLNGGDLTGTVIEAVNGKSFGVFGGHEAVKLVDASSGCCADHLEEMLFPTSTWGKTFAIGRTVPRRNTPDMLRIVAASNATSVSISPPPPGGSCPALNAGGHCDVLITSHTEITATQPIAVAHLMRSAILGMDGTGDPSLGMVPPVEQYRTDYKFLAPMNYDEQFVTIVGTAGDVVQLDGTTVTGGAPLGATRMAYRIPIGVGAHAVTCSLGCGVEVYGWSPAVSYLFAGGTDLHPIVIE
ncbi:MAG: IgGFc-binding protein, partial [Polyangiales bacterium]